VLSLAPRAAQAADAFDGSERVGRLLPRWVAEAALRGRLPHLPQLKCAFVLYPAEVHMAAKQAPYPILPYPTLLCRTCRS
jgi:hypothetical protein